MNDPTEPLRFVSATDPAIDWTLCAPMEYAKTRDPLALHFVPGKQPTWWTVRPLDVDQWASIEETGSAQRRLIQCVMHALVSIETPDGGNAWRPTRLVPMPGGVDLTICSAEEMKHLFSKYGGARLYEIGSVIYERASVGKDQSGDALFTPPPVLLDELAAIARRRVADGQKKQETETSPNS